MTSPSHLFQAATGVKYERTTQKIPYGSFSLVLFKAVLGDYGWAPPFVSPFVKMPASVIPVTIRGLVANTEE